MKILLTTGLVALLCCLANVTECRAAAPPGVLGMTVKMEDGWLTVVAVHEDYPTSQQGLRTGDRITRIYGQNTLNKTPEECLQRLAGRAGEISVLTIARGNQETPPFEVTLIRQSRIHPPTEEGERVQWNGNKIVSRVLPYADLNSLFIRLPIAHAAATGKRVKVAVL